MIKRIGRKEIHFSGVRSVVVLGDNGCRPPEMLNLKAFKKILKIKTDLFIIVGDLVFKGKANEFRKLFKFCRRVTKVPIFAAVGNHDLPMYAKFCGRSSYAIILDRVGFICLDNAKRKFPKSDTAFLKTILNKYKEKKFFIIFHIPPPLKFDRAHIEYAEWEKIKNVLDNFKKRIAAIICGHIHAFLEYWLDGYHIIITGGGGARLFDLIQDRLKAYHALELSDLDNGKLKARIIAVTGKRKYKEVKI